MRLPICELCAATGELCSGCQHRLENGMLTPLDVEASRVLYRNQKRYALERVDLERALDLGRLAILLSRSEAGLLVGKEGRIAQALGQQLKRHIRVIEAQCDLRSYAEQLFLPVKPLGLNTLYRPQGQEYRVRIARADLARLPTDLESLKRGLAARSDKPISIQFE